MYPDGGKQKDDQYWIAFWSGACLFVVTVTVCLLVLHWLKVI